MWKDETHHRGVCRYLQDATRNQHVWFAKSRREENVADGLRKTVSQKELMDNKIQRQEPRSLIQLLGTQTS